MVHSLQLRLAPHIAFSAAALRDAVAAHLHVDAAQELREVRIRRRSIDARMRTVMVQLTIDAYVGEEPPALPSAPTAFAGYPDVSAAGRQAVVVGAGPAGLFAALRLIESGIRPVVLERGKDVHERRKDIALTGRKGIVDAESNYAFGEGGAGAFSDGKLYTRSKKRGSVEEVLLRFHRHGAADDILIDTHPHIGTDRLPGIIANMRRTILASGGQVLFGRRVERLLVEKGRCRGVVTADGQVWSGDVILATGHSARDTYRSSLRDGLALQAKALAVGVRLEHPAHLIDSLQYHSPEGRGRWLPAAEYNFVAQEAGRGVYSFCMCPGGVIVPAASGSEQIVVNGMSASGRSSRWSNSGMVVETRVEDLEGELLPFLRESLADSDFGARREEEAREGSPLRMMVLQEALERAAWRQSPGKLAAPAQRMADFVNRKLSADLPAASYTPGVVASPLHFWLPTFVTKRLQAGFRTFGARARGFLTNNALIVGVETRTSSPVRMLRDPDTLLASGIAGLYPCGEGAGYAGGIVSAAIDGLRCAEALAASRM